MRFLRKGCSLLLALLLVLLLGGQLLAVTASRTLLRPEFVKVRLQAGFYAGVQDLLASRIAAQTQAAPVQFTPAEAASLVRQVLPEAELRARIGPLIDNLYAWLLGSGQRPVLLVNLRSVRSKVGPAVRDLVHARIAALPACPTLTMPRMENGFPTCRLEGIGGTAMLAAVDAALSDEKLTRDIPEQLDVAAQIEQDQGSAVWQRLDGLRFGLRVAAGTARWGWLPVLVLAGLLWLLNRDRPHTPLGWLGWPMLLAGALCAGAAYQVQPWATALVAPGDPAGALAAPIVADLVHGVVQTLRLASAVCAGVGLVLLLLRLALVGSDRP